jgi:4'-phosphopantetheinyl transferase
MNSAVEIDLWVLSLDVEERQPALSAEEFSMSQSFSNALMRKRYERTRSAVRRVLGARLGIVPEEISLAKSPGGKPRVIGAKRCEFSLSHSGEFLVMVTADVPVGVDIETRSPREGGLGLAERFFSAVDRRVVREACAGDIEVVFLRQWVAKEAALKALGMGIGGGLADAECEYLEGQIHAVRLPCARLSVRPFTLSAGIPGAVAFSETLEPTLRWRDARELDA